MQKTLLLLIGLSAPIFMQAQITLSSANAPSVAQSQVADTFTKLKLTALPSLAPGTNATWNLTTAGDSTNFYKPTGVASNSAFPNATFQGQVFYPFSALSYDAFLMKNVTANGVLNYGVHINRQALSLAALSGNTADSLVFITQDVIYSTPKHEIKYPITMNDSWTDVIKYNTAFNITITAYGLNNTPGERRTEYTTINNVIGWGKVKVNDKNGSPTGWMDVLLIKTETTSKDSFYIGGNPAPSQLLSAFGLTQNNLSHKYQYQFRRAGEYAPLVEVNFTNNTYSTIIGSEVHLLRLQAPTSLATISSEQINIYPNPITKGSFTVHLKDVSGNLNYQLYNIAGQQVAKGIVPTNGIISLQENISTGSYLLKVQTDKGQYGVKQIQIVH